MLRFMEMIPLIGTTITIVIADMNIYPKSLMEKKGKEVMEGARSGGSILPAVLRAKHGFLKVRDFHPQESGYMGGSDDYGFNGPNTDRMELGRKVDSFNQMRDWSRGHNLSRMQKEWYDQQRDDLVKKGEGMADGGMWEGQEGGEVPVGPPGIDTVPTMTQAGEVMLDSQPGAQEYILTPEMVDILGGADVLDTLRMQVHDFDRTEERREMESGGYSDGGVLPTEEESRSRVDRMVARMMEEARREREEEENSIVPEKMKQVPVKNGIVPRYKRAVEQRQKILDQYDQYGDGGKVMGYADGGENADKKAIIERAGRRAAEQAIYNAGPLGPIYSAASKIVPAINDFRRTNVDPIVEDYSKAFFGGAPVESNIPTVKTLEGKNVPVEEYNKSRAILAESPGYSISRDTSPESRDRYIAQLRAAGGEVIVDPVTGRDSYVMPVNYNPDLGRQVNEVGGPNWDAFTTENVNKAIADAKAYVPGTGYDSAGEAERTRLEGGLTAAQKYYDMPASERGRRPDYISESLGLPYAAPKNEQQAFEIDQRMNSRNAEASAAEAVAKNAMEIQKEMIKAQGDRKEPTAKITVPFANETGAGSQEYNVPISLVPEIMKQQRQPEFYKKFSMLAKMSSEDRAAALANLRANYPEFKSTIDSAYPEN